MKKLKTILLSLLITISFMVNAQTKNVDISKSKINWVGKKITGEHIGTIKLKDGVLLFKDNKLAGGTFTVDMTSLTATDLTGEYQQQLNGHLKSADFFGTEKHPLSTLVFKKIAVKSPLLYTVTGDLTIKGITNSVTFDMATKENMATTNLKIDRTKYGIKYGSGSFFENLGDKTISNDFELKVALVY